MLQPRLTQVHLIGSLSSMATGSETKDAYVKDSVQKRLKVSKQLGLKAIIASL